MNEARMMILQKKRQVMIRGEKVPGKICPPGSDYCWQCGHVAPAEEFEREDRCPNPDCPRPKCWND